MRTYPTNSPQAAARIVALTLVADGHLSSTELAVLERVDAYRQLGITAAQMLDVLREFCEDRLAAHQSTWTDACHIDPRALAHWMAEIEDPALRTNVLRLCVAVVKADGHVADGESIVLDGAVEHWGLPRQILQGPAVRMSVGPE